MAINAPLGSMGAFEKQFYGISVPQMYKNQAAQRAYETQQRLSQLFPSLPETMNLATPYKTNGGGNDIYNTVSKSDLQNYLNTSFGENGGYFNELNPDQLSYNGLSPGAESMLGKFNTINETGGDNYLNNFLSGLSREDGVGGTDFGKYEASAPGGTTNFTPFTPEEAYSTQKWYAENKDEGGFLNRKIGPQLKWAVPAAIAMMGTAGLSSALGAAGGAANVGATAPLGPVTSEALLASAPFNAVPASLSQSLLAAPTGGAAGFSASIPSATSGLFSTGSVLKGAGIGGLSGFSEGGIKGAIKGAAAGGFTGGLGAGQAFSTGAGVLGGGGSLQDAALSTVGSHYGGKIGGELLPTSIGDVFGSAGNVLGSGVANTSIGSVLGGYAGNALARDMFNSSNPEYQSPLSATGTDSGPAPFEPRQEQQLQLPGSLSGMSTFSPEQVSSGIATQGVYGGGQGPEEQAYFKNLINRRLVDESGQVDQNLNDVLPIEQSYLAQIGLGGYNNPSSLLEAMSRWQAT